MRNNNDMFRMLILLMLVAAIMMLMLKITFAAEYEGVNDIEQALDMASSEEDVDSATKYTYVVEYWQQKLDGNAATHDENNYKRVDSIAGTADAGSTITPAVKAYTGFQSPSIGMWVVNEDQMTFKYYYERESYDLTINTTTGISNVTGTGTYMYQEQVTITASTSEGYVFSGWTGSVTSNLASYTFKMPANSVLVTANATSEKNIAYQVNYWQQNLAGDADIEDDENYTMVAHTNATGTAFDDVTPKLNTYTGFITPAPKTEQIKPDGSLVIDYYYKRQSYNVELTAGTGVDFVSGGGDYLYGATVTIDARMTPGYSFTKWSGTSSYTAKNTSFVISKDMKLTAEGKIQTYSVTYYLDGGTNAKNNPTSYKTTDSIVLSEPTKKDYYFLGWYEDDKFQSPVTTLGNGMSENVKLYAKWLKKIRTIKVSYGNTYQNSGTAIDLEKLKVVSTMSNGDMEIINPEDVTFSKDRIDYGKNEITVEYDGAKDTFSVSCNVLTLLKGQKYKVSEMAKVKKEKGYKVKTTDKKVAKMSSKGVITTKSRAGEATLFTIRGDGSSQEFKVCVEIPKWTKKYKLSKGDVQNVNMSGTTQKVEYISSNKTVAPVDEFGNITAKKTGKATITSIINGKKYKTSVKVL